MKIELTMTRAQLGALVENARWFAGCYVRSKRIGESDNYAVVTNYPSARLFLEG